MRCPKKKYTRSKVYVLKTIPPEGEGLRTREMEIKGLGGDKLAREIWGKLTGYSRRALVETSFSRLKRLYGERFFSKKVETQKVEGHIKCKMLNQMLLTA